MKFLEIQDFDAISRALDFVGDDCRVIAKCELYTTKAAGHDKKLYKSIDRQLEERYQEDAALMASRSPEMAGAVEGWGHSPFGPLDMASSRRTFAFLVATLNASYPDHDFSGLRPYDFRKERHVSLVINALNSTIQRVARTRVSTHDLWHCVDRHIELNGCDVYCFQPDGDSDPTSSAMGGMIWSMSYFFFNRNLKRVLFFHLSGHRTASPNLQRPDTDDFGDWPDDLDLQD